MSIPYIMKQLVYFILLINCILWCTVSCDRSSALNNFSAPRSDIDRLEVLEKIRSDSVPAIPKKQLQQAGMGSDYYYSYHLEKMGNKEDAFILALEGVSTENPWLEYSVLRAYNLTEKKSDRLKELNRHISKLNYSEQRLAGVLYVRSRLAYRNKKVAETVEFLGFITPDDAEKLHLTNSIHTLRTLANARLRLAYWQNNVTDMVFTWPFPPHFSTIVGELQSITTEKELPVLPIIVAMNQIQKTRSGRDFTYLNQLINDKHMEDFFILYPRAVRPYIQLAGMTNQRTIAIDYLQKILIKNKNINSHIRFEILRGIAILKWRLGLYKESIPLLQEAVSLANNIDYNDVLWYYLFSLYKDDLSNFLDVLNQTSPLIHQDAGWFDNLFQPMLRDLVAQHNFFDLEKLYNFIIEKQASNQISASYSWVLARAMQHNYLPMNRTTMLSYLQKATMDPFSYAAFMAATELNEVPAALHNTKNYVIPSLDSITDASAILTIDKDSLTLSTFASITASTQYITPDLHLLGFVYYNLPDIAVAQAREKKNIVEIDTLRLLARSLNENGYYLDSIRIMNLLRNRPLFQPDRGDLEILYPLVFHEAIHQAAQNINMNTSIYLGLIRTESGFSPEIESRASAVGLTQIMPATAREVARKLNIPESEIDLTDITQNLHLSSNYIYWMQGRLDGLYAILAGYNSGPNRVRKWKEEWRHLPSELFIEAIPFDETRNYVKSIVVASAVYEYLYKQEAPIFIISEIFPGFKRSNIYATQ